MTTPDTGQLLAWNAASSRWVNVDPPSGGGATALSGLSDVSVTTPDTGQLLAWNAAAEKWVNATPGGGIGIEITYDDAANEFLFDRVETIHQDDDGSTITFDLAADVGEHHEVTLGGNRTLAVTNPTRGQKFRLKLNQDATGGREVTWFAGITWVNGYDPAQTPVPSSGDTFAFLVTNVGGYGDTFLGWILSTERAVLITESSGPSLAASSASWPFDSDVADAAGTADFVAGSATAVSGHLGNAAGFSGSYLRANDQAAIRGGDRDYSISLWFKPTTIPPPFVGTVMLIGKTNGSGSYDYRVALTTNVAEFTDIGFLHGITSGSGFGVVSYEGTTSLIGDWHHLVAVHDRAADEVRIYLDGARVHTADISSLVGLDSGHGLYLGGLPASLQFDGAIDQTDFFEAALSDVSVEMLFNDGVGLEYPFELSSPFNLDWSICEGAALTLTAGTGNYQISHVNPIPGKTIHLTIANDGASGTLAWSGVAVDWGPSGAPALPADGDSIYLEFRAESTTDIKGKYWFGGGAGVSVATRSAAAIGAAYQPSATRDTLVSVSVSISSGAAGDGTLELLCDAANPPTTVRGTFRVGTALSAMAGQLGCLVPKGHYWKLLSTTAGGTPTYAIVGNVQEVGL